MSWTSPINEHLSAIESVAGELRHYSRAFDTTGNRTMADALNRLADELDEATNGVRHSIDQDLSRQFKEYRQDFGLMLNAALESGERSHK